jgi:hypothetical protein
MKVLMAAVLAACCGLAVPAAAQTPAAAVPSGMFDVYVTNRAGQEVRGRLVGLTASDVTVNTGGAIRTLNLTDVSLIERKGDSLKNGTIIGAVVGGAVAALMVGETCAGVETGQHCTGQAIAFSLISVGVYAAIGAGIDALIPGRTRIYPAKPDKSGVTVAFGGNERRAFVGWRKTF